MEKPTTINEYPQGTADPYEQPIQYGQQQAPPQQLNGQQPPVYYNMPPQPPLQNGQQQQQQPVYYVQQTPQYAVPGTYTQVNGPVVINSDLERECTVSFWLMVIGFFIAIVGFINVCMHFKSKNLRAKKYAKISLIVSCIQLAVVVTLIILSATVWHYTYQQYCSNQRYQYYDWSTGKTVTDYNYVCY